MARTVLVTGGSGFIGSYILRQLVERGDTAINFDLNPPRPQAAWWLRSVHQDIQFIQGSIDTWSDLFSAIQRTQPDSIIHTAAIGSPVILNQRPSLALAVNVQGSFNVLEAARIFNIQRVVYFSSIAVLPKIQYEPVDTNHPIMLSTEGPGASFYAASKVSSEAFCWAYHQSFGLDFIILRPSAVYGFGMFIPIYIQPMVENTIQGQPTRFPQGREFPRDYTHVSDVAQLALRSLDIPANQVHDRIFYAASGQPLHTAGQVSDFVKELLPSADIEIGSGLSQDDLIEIRYRGLLSIQNAQEQLGYQPQFTHLRDGIADYIHHYRTYLDDISS